MPLYDLAVLIVITVFALQGFGRGFVASLTSLAGMVVTFIVALWAHPIILGLLESIGASLNITVQLVIFFIVFLIIGRVLGAVVKLINRAFRVITAIPFTKSIDRVLGGVFGLAEGILLAALLTVVVLSMPSLPESLQAAVDASWMIRVVVFVLGIGTMFLPDSWQSVFERAI